MSGRTAIVTLAIGAEYSDRWHRLCEANWRRYADRHGYDLICIEEPLDDSQRARHRSPSWQKLLLPGQPFAGDYERIVWVDCDVVFGHDAPPVTAGVPLEKVGAVDEVGGLPVELKRMLYMKPFVDYYREYGFDGTLDHVVQAGVMVLSPRFHAELFEHIYETYEDKPGTFYEMRPLSWELQQRDLVHWLDPRFNTLWIVYRATHDPVLIEPRRHPRLPALAQQALSEIHCLHFAGEAGNMDFALRSPARPRKTESPATTRSPVALFLYRRPDTSARVLDAVREAKPTHLFVVANAPREDVEGEAELCEATRALIDTVDWDCEIATDFASTHLPQTERIESGLDWVFEHCEEAIILEDDCVPDRTFFRFCDELLERYREQEQVMSISGNNFQFDSPASDDSYYLSRYPLTWGWATWRSAWRRNDPAMTAWPKLRDSGWLGEFFEASGDIAYWSHIFEITHRDRDAWDRAWLFSCWLEGGLHAIPNVNLVSNIGFREDATHTTPVQGRLLADLPTEPMGFPLRHPAELARNEPADLFTGRLLYGGNVGRMLGRVRRMRHLLEATT
jgi:hypothetical protein